MKVRALWSRLRGSLRRDDSLEREMREEMAFHVEMATRRNEERGMTPEAARRHAKLAFGSAESFREAAREAQRARSAEQVVSDIRFTVRSLRRAPAFTVATVLTLALGIGASTAMYTVVNAVLLRPLPIPEPDDFMYVGWAWAEGDEVPALTAAQYEFVRDNGRSFEAVAAYERVETNAGEVVGGEAVHGLRVTGGFFRTVGFALRLGREFDVRELSGDGAAAVILGDAVWRARFGADPAILGRGIHLDGEPHTVVGVLPPEFRFPPAPSNTGYIVPFVIEADPAERGNNTAVIGRLRNGVPESTLASDLRALSGAFLAANPSLAAEGGSFRLFTHGDVHVGSALRRTLWILFGLVSLVLLIGCANTAMLLLVRASSRHREIAVRAAIGAGPSRIVQQLLTEGLVLSAAAAAAGVLIAALAVRGFLVLAPTALPAGAEPAIDMAVLTWATGLSIVTGVMFGLAAAGPALSTRLRSFMSHGARGAGGRSARIREALVFLEAAVAVVLLSGATLLTSSFVRLIRVDPGFDTDRVIAIRLGGLGPEFDATTREQLVVRLLERIRALPGIENAAAAPNLPLERGRNMPVDTPERPELAIGAVELRFVSPGYLGTLGIPLRSGRDFDERDLPGTEPVAVVNEAFARHFWGGARSPGRTIRIGHFRDRWLPSAVRQHTRVVGVAADIRELGLDRSPRPTVLVPRAQAAGQVRQDDPAGGSQALLRTPVLLVRGALSALATTLREEILAEEPRITPAIERLSAVVSHSVAEPRFRTLLVAAFAGFALLLAAIGIYGVIACVVQQRHREIGIRLALGANRAGVMSAVAGRCLLYVGAGTAAGLLMFGAARRVLASWLYDISPGDPRVLIVTTAVFALVALVASWIPARRASRVDPARSLRPD
jgi:predicted permease